MTEARQLAEGVLRATHTGGGWSYDEVRRLARELLSALDALDEARKELDRSLSESFGYSYSRQRDLRKAAEAERDQARKERDEWIGHAATAAQAKDEVLAERDRLQTQLDQALITLGKILAGDPEAMKLVASGRDALDAVLASMEQGE